MGPMFIMTAGLLIGQTQEIQVIGPEIVGPQKTQSAPTGLFGRLRNWRGSASNSGPVDRPFAPKMQGRFSIFGRGHVREAPPAQTVYPAIPVTPSAPSVTTSEPPILEQYVTPRPTSTSSPRNP